MHVRWQMAGLHCEGQRLASSDRSGAERIREKSAATSAARPSRREPCTPRRSAMRRREAVRHAPTRGVPSRRMLRRRPRGASARTCDRSPQRRPSVGALLARACARAPAGCARRWHPAARCPASSEPFFPASGRRSVARRRHGRRRPAAPPIGSWRLAPGSVDMRSLRGLGLGPRARAAAGAAVARPPRSTVGRPRGMAPTGLRANGVRRNHTIVGCPRIDRRSSAGSTLR